MRIIPHREKVLAVKLLDLYGLPEEIMPYDSIYIYGAGMVGNFLLEYLIDRGFRNKIAGFLTTNEQEGEEKGFPRKKISQKTDMSGSIVLVAAKRKVRMEMLETCDRLGISGIKEIDVLDDRDYTYYSNLPEEAYPLEMKEWYWKNIGHELNLDNPVTYNDKINWMKLYDKDPLRTTLADKYLVRDYVEKKIGKEILVPLLGIWDDADEIDFSDLPKRFVLKCNHGCGWNVIVKDKDKLNIPKTREKLAQWLNTNYAFVYGFEMIYQNIRPRIIAEEYLENAEDDLYDYKFWCFGGKVEFIMFLSERQKGLRMNNFDINWNPLPFTYGYPNSTKKISKPSRLREMIQIAEKLAEGFPHVRVDLYLLNDGSIRFGEMTFTSASGACAWTDKHINKHLGDLIQL